MKYPSLPQSGSGSSQAPGGYNRHSAVVPSAPGKASRARLARTVALVVCAILVAIGVIVIMAGIGLERVTSGQPASAADRVSGDRDEWSAAVCEGGAVSTLSTGQIRFPHVENFASCMSAVPGSGGGVVPIIIGEWPDMSTMRQDLDHYKMIRYSAWAGHDDGVIVFGSMGDTGTMTLEPLAKFGFSIAPLR